MRLLSAASVQRQREIRFAHELAASRQPLLHLRRSTPGERCHLQQVGGLCARQGHRIGQRLFTLTLETVELFVLLGMQLHLLVDLLFSWYR